MKTLCHRRVEYKTVAHEYPNGLVYVQNWANNQLQDDFFAHAGDLYPDGTLRPNKTKYFYSPVDDPEKKEIGLLRNKWPEFKWFDRLFFFNQDGDVEQIKLN